MCRNGSVDRTRGLSGPLLSTLLVDTEGSPGHAGPASTVTAASVSFHSHSPSNLPLKAARFPFLSNDYPKDYGEICPSRYRLCSPECTLPGRYFHPSAVVEERYYLPMTFLIIHYLSMK